MPLEISGAWEVALTQVIIKPSLMPVQADDYTVLLNDTLKNETISFELGTSSKVFVNNSGLISFFNSHVPKGYKDKLSLSTHASGCLKLTAKDVKIKFSEYLGHLFGFEPDIWIPDVSDIAQFEPNFMGNTGIVKVLCDIVFPQIYSSPGNSQVLHTFVLPENRQ